MTSETANLELARMAQSNVITINTFEGAREAFRSKDLRQALYDEGEVVMADVLVNLHADAHRARRRLENRLFRRDTHAWYERELFPPVVAATLAPYVDAGGAELVSVSHQLMMNLAALTAGVDRPLGTADETFHLYSYLMLFIEGATLAHFAGDRDAKRTEVAAALAAFDAEFLQPSVQRRLALIAQHANGTIEETALPRDVLTILLRNQDKLDLPSEVVLRETCFYLLAGAHTSATAFVRTLNNVFTHEADHPERSESRDLAFLQRCTHETIRLQPSSPVALRWAVNDIELANGVRVRTGDKVEIDLNAANREESIFGENPNVFNPDRDLAPGVWRWGLSFGLGMHACIGQDLAAGMDAALSAGMHSTEDHLYGLVPVALKAILDAGATLDPSNPPLLDPKNTRGYWGTYPVVFNA